MIDAPSSAVADAPPPLEPPRPSRVTHLAGLVSGMAILALVARRFEPQALASQLVRTGPRAALLLIPTALGLLAHALAWRTLLGKRPPTVTVRGLARIHLAAEAARVALPGGAALGELAAARGVRDLGLPLRGAVASLLRKRA
ncbi:MAG: flippase-like domain-containing protein [Deltaproteobacteria bacterium]|nr:flippase-like domain-containing protein [Deltaproteobacteria bacterium]